MGITIGTVCSIWFRYGLHVPTHADISLRSKANGARNGKGSQQAVNGFDFLRQSSLYQVKPRKLSAPCGPSASCEFARRPAGGLPYDYVVSLCHQVALLYMASRLFLTLSLVYMPLYLDEALNQDAETLASVPFASFVASFVASLGVKYSNGFLGSKVSASAQLPPRTSPVKVPDVARTQLLKKECTHLLMNNMCNLVDRFDDANTQRSKFSSQRRHRDSTIEIHVGLTSLRRKFRSPSVSIVESTGTRCKVEIFGYSDVDST